MPQINPYTHRQTSGVLSAKTEAPYTLEDNLHYVSAEDALIEVSNYGGPQPCYTDTSVSTCNSSETPVLKQNSRCNYTCSTSLDDDAESEAPSNEKAGKTDGKTTSTDKIAISESIHISITIVFF